MLIYFINISGYTVPTKNLKISIPFKIILQATLPEKVTACCQHATMTRNNFIFHKYFKVKKNILFSEPLQYF